jgi:hypothetical protein
MASSENAGALEEEPQPVTEEPGRTLGEVIDTGPSLAHKLQTTTTSGGLLRLDLPLPASDFDFLCKPTSPVPYRHCAQREEVAD